MRVGIVAQRGNARAAYLAADIADALPDEVEVWVDEASADAAELEGHEVSEFSTCDLVVSIGGDGTFLFAARGAGSVPVLGVNLGEVGFLNAVAPDDAVAAVKQEVERYLETGAVRSRDVPRIEASGADWVLTPALNEVVVQGPQRGHGQGVTVEVRVDGSLYTASHADGVLVSTPTGSTAYNLSEGGPLVHPSVGGFVVTEMCGYESMPPLVVDEDSTVTVRLTDTDIGYVVSDGRAKHELDAPAQITIDRAPDPVRIAGPALDFFAGLGKLE